MMRNKKGQLSIINLFLFLILVVISAILTPIANDFIQAVISTNNFSDTSILVMNSVVPLWWVGIIITFFIYISPVRQSRLF